MKHLALFFLLLSAQTLEAKLIATCSEWSPFYFRKGQQIEGDVHTLTEQVLAKAGLTADFTIEPWPRALLNTQEQPNYLLTCLGYTRARASRFQWIGKSTKGLEYKFFRLASSQHRILSLHDLDDVMVGVIRDSHGLSYLQQHVPNAIPVLLTTIEQQLLTLLKGRVSYILLSEPALQRERDALQIDPESIVEEFQAYDATTYLAMGLSADPELVKRLKQAYVELVSQNKLSIPSAR